MTTSGDAPAFTRAEFEACGARLLRDGRTANAVVSCVTLAGRTWTVKDFSSRPWWVRRFIAPFLLSRELAAFARLKGIDGIAQHAFRIDQYAMAVEFMPGKAVNQAQNRITPAYLEALERLVDAMHARGIVHLDLRGSGNVMCRDDGTPGLIDFQSSLATDRMPKRLRKLLEDMDVSGVLKKWMRYQPEAMGEVRRAELERINRVRRFWIFRGYFGLKKGKK